MSATPSGPQDPPASSVTGSFGVVCLPSAARDESDRGDYVILAAGRAYCFILSLQRRLSQRAGRVNYKEQSGITGKRVSVHALRVNLTNRVQRKTRLLVTHSSRLPPTSCLPGWWEKEVVDGEGKELNIRFIPCL